MRSWKEHKGELFPATARIGSSSRWSFEGTK